jgi:tRNA-specific 2-thiouridylase
LGIGGTRNHGEEPWYVVQKDLTHNRLVVGQGHNHAALFSGALEASTLHWIAGTAPPNRYRCTAKVRYRQADQACTVSAGNEKLAEVGFDQPQRAVTPGQFVVFYAGDECLGSGVIEKTATVRPRLLAAAV